MTNQLGDSHVFSATLLSPAPNIVRGAFSDDVVYLFVASVMQPSIAGRELIVSTIGQYTFHIIHYCVNETMGTDGVGCPTVSSDCVCMCGVWMDCWSHLIDPRCTMAACHTSIGRIDADAETHTPADVTT